MHKQKREKMNILKFSLSVSVLSFLLIACGGSGSSGNSGGKSKPSIKAETIEQAENNLVALGYILSGNSRTNLHRYNKIFDSQPIGNSRTNLQRYTKIFDSQPSLKEERIVECDQGTVETSEDENSVTAIYRKCIFDGKYLDGTVMGKVVSSDSTITKTTEYSNYTSKEGTAEYYLDIIEKITASLSGKRATYSLNGVHNRTFAGNKNNVTYNNFIEKTTDKTATFNGEIELGLGCIAGTYIVETVEKLVYPHKNKSIGNIISGTLKLNGATYTFEAPYLIVEAGGESKTYYQNNIKKRMLSYRERNCNY